MKYRLYEGSKNDTSNVVRNILKNRGIKNYKEYLHLSSNCKIPYSELDNIDDAVKMFIKKILLELFQIQTWMVCVHLL